MFTVNNCLFPGNRTSLTRTAKLELQWCEEQKASPSERFIYGHKWRIWRLTLWLLANCSFPWSERKDLCHISIVTRRVMVGTELRSCILGAFLGLSARLFLQRAVWKKAPSESVEMPSPITAAAGVRPWQHAPNQPENWLKNDQLPEKRPGRRDSEKYGFYLIQLNCKRN